MKSLAAGEFFSPILKLGREQFPRDRIQPVYPEWSLENNMSAPLPKFKYADSINLMSTPCTDCVLSSIKFDQDKSLSLYNSLFHQMVIDCFKTRLQQSIRLTLTSGQWCPLPPVVRDQVSSVIKGYTEMTLMVTSLFYSSDKLSPTVPNLTPPWKYTLFTRMC